MKVIQNILAINFILCLARHWLSNLRHQGTRCIGGEKIKVGGGGGGGGGGQYSIFSTFLDSFLSNKQQRVRFEESSFSLFGLSKGPCRLPFVPHCCH